jgi:hypothetical protein
MTDPKMVAIHQPNFLPWLGYFDKLVRSDTFIILDNVQFPKTGGTWINRVRILVNGQPVWCTLPIVRAYHGTRRISEMEINDSTSWRDKLLKTLQMNYNRAPFFKSVFPFLEELISQPTGSLAEYNIISIRSISQRLGLDTSKFIIGSTLNVTGAATELLISMVKAVGGTSYLCGGGAGGYQDDDLFDAHCIELVYQDFNHPTYLQIGADQFVPGLSIIDCLLNCGWDGTRKLINASI